MRNSAPPTPWPQRLRLRRLWQPRNGLFWLMLLFNGLSTGMAWFLHLSPPAGGLLLLFTLLALANAAIGMALLWLLWRGG
ncbi:MAG: hypothetical protein JM57_03215 [Comamonadaceae bacterium BICA1-1]|nr:MAG: hypothetical protein JM57_03215 [Comamonadaceae bacterium BICA1-1]